MVGVWSELDEVIQRQDAAGQHCMQIDMIAGLRAATHRVSFLHCHVMGVRDRKPPPGVVAKPVRKRISQKRNRHVTDPSLNLFPRDEIP